MSGTLRVFSLSPCYKRTGSDTTLGIPKRVIRYGPETSLVMTPHRRQRPTRLEPYLFSLCTSFTVPSYRRDLFYLSLCLSVSLFLCFFLCLCLCLSVSVRFFLSLSVSLTLLSLSFCSNSLFSSSVPLSFSDSFSHVYRLKRVL